MPSAVRIPASLSCWMARDPFELYDGDLVEDFENLTSAESTTWSSNLRTDNWQAFVSTVPSKRNLLFFVAGNF
jgi:hypothetical protein